MQVFLYLYHVFIAVIHITTQCATHVFMFFLSFVDFLNEFTFFPSFHE